MPTKLIIVEGLPGSGKSTTAQQVCDILKAKGIDTELYSEGNFNHPADFDGVAFFNSEEFNMLEKAHSESNDILNKIKIKYLNGYLIPYRKAIEEQLITFENELFSDITKNDIYDLPIELHMELILSRWKDFAANYVNKDKVVVFECCFIQNPITVSMIKNNCLKDINIGYINNLANIIMPLEPILIYVDQGSFKESFMKAISERPKEWINGFTDYYTNQGYGLNNNLKGIEGVIEVLRARNNLEKEIYDSLNLTKYKINNSEFNLKLLKEKINSIIERNF
jgi:Cdc6-like AAA superfamily ATPase